MFALFHLILTLIKISIQASIYATILFLILYLLNKNWEKKIINKWMERKLLTWWIIGLVFSVGLFCYSFTYWGNHGFGDSARIPIGYGQTIYNGDGVWTYFYADLSRRNDQYEISEYEIKNNKLCASQEEEDKYFVFDLESSELQKFDNKVDYENFALKNELPLPDEFHDFFYHYQNYWGGWRFYFLP